MSEIKIHRSLRHENVVGFEHFFEDSDNVYILLEMCENQTMSELLKRRKRLTELEVRCYAMQLLGAMKYLHSHRVIHRDLKIGNIFLNEKMQIKTGDFGLATKLEFEGERKRTICGTPNYIAPEVLDGKQGHSYEVDIWSFGVILYTVLIGKPPFETSDVKTTYRRIRMNAYSFPEHVSISDQAKSLITRILHSDPARRPSLDDIISHDFFHMGGSIPKTLPSSTLACPPSSSYIRQFMPNQPATSSSTQRMAETAPQSMRGSNDRKAEMLQTDRVPSRPSSGSKPAFRRDHPEVKTDRVRPQPPVKNPTSSNYTPEEGKKKAGVAAAVTTGQPEVWVKKWVDYSSKYGLGYILSNGCTGVFFNDSTKIILEQTANVFHYIERKGADRQDVASNYKLDDYPKEMSKKVTLLQHFRSYLEVEGRSETKLEGEEETPKEAPVYVKKWMRTRHAIMFRLSNKIVQVNFQDSTEIILSSESRVVTYVNKRGERNSYPLTSALESTNAEMTKRLKYTKDILTHMLNQGATTGTTPASSTRRK